MSDGSNIGPIRPYGPPIMEAIASGDTTRMRQAGENARQWLEQNPGHEHQDEVRRAVRELEQALGSGSHVGTVMPYGVAIREAAASGDASRVRQAADQARRWLEQNPGHEKQGEVQGALRELEQGAGGTSHFGPMPPYGVAIREAMSSGDQGKIRQAAEHARRWLSENPGHEKHGEVQGALRELDARHGGGG